MTQFTVGIQPQAIFEHGMQEARSIANMGPWTVYLDSNSSVNESSYPLPPTGTIVWDADTPLWAVAAGNANVTPDDSNYSPSVLSITKNSYQGLAPRAATVDRIFSRTGALSGPGVFTFPTLETASYNTLLISYGAEPGSSSLVLPAIDREFNVTIVWLSSDDQMLTVDEYISPALASANPKRGVTLTVPIRGSKADITFTYTDATPVGSDRFRLEVYATSRTLPNRQDWMSSTIDVINATNYDAGSIEKSLTGYYGITNWEGSIADSIFLNGIGNDIQMSLRMSAAVTTQGRVLVQSYYDPAIIFNDVAVPVVANAQTILSRFLVPLSTPVIITASPAPVTAGAIRVGINWKDYNG